MSSANNARLSAKDIAKLLENKPAPVAPVSSSATVKGQFLNATESGVETLHVNDIEIYDRNPRSIENSEFLAIKGSIKVMGIKTPLTVTHIPTQAKGKYTLAAGGGTRLAALRELHKEEPNNPLFARITCMVVPYLGELQMLASHVIENTQRADMCWWDEAKGIAVIRDQLELELKSKLSSRDLEVQIKALGLSTNKTFLIECLYTVTHLEGIGLYKTALKRTEVRSELQPLHTGLRSLLQLAKQTPQPEADALWCEILTAHFGLLPSPEAYNFTDLVEATHNRLSIMLSVTPVAVKAMIESIKRDPKVSYALLLASTQELPLTLNQGGAQDAAEDNEYQDVGGGDSETPSPLTESAQLSSNTHSPGLIRLPPEQPPGFVAPTLPIPSKSPITVTPPKTYNSPAAPAPQSPVQAKTGLVLVYEAAKAIAEYAGLDECVFPSVDAPIGYFMDLPAGMVLTAAENLYASQGIDHTIWWCLHTYSQVGENEEEIAAALTYLPDTAILKTALKDDESYAAAINNRIGEPLEPHCIAFLMRLSCEDNGRGALVRKFIECIAAVQKSTRWITVNSMTGGDA